MPPISLADYALPAACLAPDFCLALAVPDPAFVLEEVGSVDLAAVAAVAMKRVSRQFSEIMRCVAAGKKYIITNLARPLDCVAEISMSLP